MATREAIDAGALPASMPGIVLEPARFARTGGAMLALVSIREGFGAADLQALDAPAYVPSGGVRCGHRLENSLYEGCPYYAATSEPRV